MPAIELTPLELDGVTLLLGPAGQPLLRTAADATELVQASFYHSTRRLLLYAENLTPAFFDLSSRDAGEILGKLRTYQVRLAVVYAPAVTQFSTNFAALMREENRQPYFRLFADQPAAEAWLREDL